MTILTLLEEHLGQHIQQRDEYLFRCPFCHHSKKKLSINIVTNKWKCWICDAKGARLLSLVKKMSLPKVIIAKFKEILGETNRQEYASDDKHEVLTLPNEYIPLWKKQNTIPYLHALTYLKNRNITTDDILRHRMGYCETGPYAGRIIIPSYNSNNQLNYFTARLFYSDGMKYKNPPASKNTVIFENMVDWDEPIILCEGMFDAITLRRNAIPLMGKTLPKSLEHALLQHSVEEVIIFLDADAKQEALKLEQRLKSYEIDTKLVLLQDKDASEMGFETSWNAICSAQPTQFKEFITQRLQRI